MSRTRLQQTTPEPHPLEQSLSTVESSINTVVLQWVWVLSSVQNGGGGGGGGLLTLDWGVRRVISYKSLIQEQMDGESLKSDSLVTNQHGRIVLVAELKPIKKNFWGQI